MVSKSMVEQLHLLLIHQWKDLALVRKEEKKLGIRSSDTCVLLLDNCKVPVENVLKGIGERFLIAMNALDNSRIGIAAQALGIAQGAFESALNYSHERQSFGKPIAHHQSIGNYLADMATQIEAARMMVYKASWAKQRHYEEGGDRHTKEASMAKLFAGDTAMWVSERAVQVLEDMDTQLISLLKDSLEMQKLLKYMKEHKKFKEL